MVILIQENRSFDHYFGSYRGVRGFADPHVLRLNDGSGLSIFAQPGYPAGYDGNHLYPFHLDSFDNGECTNDINHSWGPQHAYWDGGRLDGFVNRHLTVDGKRERAADDGLLQALGFVVLLRAGRRVHDLRPLPLLGDRPDRPEPSVLDVGLARSGGHRTAGRSSRRARPGSSVSATLSWTTMPEQLQARGISWKVYGEPDGNFGDNVLPYFKQYQTNPTARGPRAGPYVPGDIQGRRRGRHAAAGLVDPGAADRQRAPAGTRGLRRERGRQRAQHARLQPGGLGEDRAVDHPRRERRLLRPCPAADGACGHRGRVPDRQPAALRRDRRERPDRARLPRAVARRLARSPRAASSAPTFDHTSLLRFLETRFGAEVPNLSSWRRSVTATSRAPSTSPRSIGPFPSCRILLTDRRGTMSTCATSAPLDLATSSTNSLKKLEQTTVATYRVKVNSTRPPQEPGKARAPSGPVR